MSLPQMVSPPTFMPSYLQTGTTDENEILNHKSSNQLQKFDMSSGYESLPYIPTDPSRLAPTFNNASLLFEQAQSKDYLNRMPTTLPRPPKNKSFTKIENYQVTLSVNNLSDNCILQSLGYIGRAEVKPGIGRKSIIQNPCHSNTHHHITSVARTLPRPSKKLPRGDRSGITEYNRIQSEKVSFLKTF